MIDSLDRADGYAATVSHFGPDSPRVAAKLEFGTRFSATWATTAAEVAEVRAWRDLGDPTPNAVLLDCTTIVTARSLLTSTSDGRITLPVLLAIVLVRSANRGELWSSLAELRADAAPYRARRVELERALADENVAVLEDVARAVETDVARLRTRLANSGPAAEELAITVAEALPEFATRPLGEIGPTLTALFAAGRALVPGPLVERILWRWTRPHYRFLSDVRAESRAIINTMPRIQRFWSVPPGEADGLIQRFRAVADLTQTPG